jgi:hypothetical protein
LNAHPKFSHLQPSLTVRNRGQIDIAGQFDLDRDFRELSTIISATRPPVGVNYLVAKESLERQGIDCAATSFGIHGGTFTDTQARYGLLSGAGFREIHTVGRTDMVRDLLVPWNHRELMALSGMILVIALILRGKLSRVTVSLMLAAWFLQLIALTDLNAAAFHIISDQPNWPWQAVRMYNETTMALGRMIGLSLLGLLAIPRGAHWPKGCPSKKALVGLALGLVNVLLNLALTGYVLSGS